MTAAVLTHKASSTEIHRLSRCIEELLLAWGGRGAKTEVAETLCRPSGLADAYRHLELTGRVQVRGRRLELTGREA